MVSLFWSLKERISVLQSILVLAKVPRPLYSCMMLWKRRGLIGQDRHMSTSQTMSEVSKRKHLLPDSAGPAHCINLQQDMQPGNMVESNGN